MSGSSASFVTRSRTTSIGSDLVVAGPPCQDYCSATTTTISCRPRFLFPENNADVRWKYAMAADRITPAAIEAESVAFDARERAVVAGQVVLDFSHAGVLAALLAPREWEAVAAYLLALVGREPMRSAAGYLPHRTILGAIGSELRQYARLAGEPVGLEADLRAATSRAEEQRIRERIADRDAAADRRHDELLLEQAAYHAHAGDAYDVVITETDLAERGIGTVDDEEEEEIPSTVTPAAPTDLTDVQLYL